MTSFAQPFSLSARAQTNAFSVANGKFVAPDGSNFIGRGVNLYSIAQAVTNSACQPLTTLFPNIGFIRLNCDGESYPSVASLSTYIDRCVALRIVVAIEDHMFPQMSPPTGTTQNNWYASFASHYINQPYVWFMTTNEPLDPGVTANHVAIYNAIRGTGSKAMILFDPIGGGGPGRQGTAAFNAASYSNMFNVGWDQHFYAWGVGFSTDQNTVNAGLASFIAADKGISTLDGPMPVFIGEWGDSTDGDNVDADWQNVVTAVTTSGYGSAAWNWDRLGGADLLLNSNGTLTAYGQLVANYCAAGTRPSA